MPGQNSFVLGTSAFLALRSIIRRGQGRGASFAGEKKPMPLLVFFMSRIEVLHNVWRGEGEDAARHELQLIDSFAVQWVSYEPNILEIVSRIKAQGGLSVPDGWIWATAITHGVTFVHKDPQFDLSKRPRKNS